MNTPQSKRHGLSKSRILLHRQCPKRLWLKVHRPELEEVDDGNQARFDTGTYVGELAQQLYPDGVLIAGDNLGQAVTDTQAALAGEKRPIFEATLQASGLLIRADLLLPSVHPNLIQPAGEGANSYRMVEVKSSTRVKDYHLTDAAIQSWVAEQAGVTLSSVEVAHIDTSFIYGGNGHYQGLLKYVNVISQISAIKAEVPAWINAARETLAGDEPCISVGNQCGDPFECSFKTYCSPVVQNKSGFPIEILPHGGKLIKTLRSQGYVDLRDVPQQHISKEKHLRVWRASKTGQPELDLEAGKIIVALPYPRYYIDFETINPAVPIWAGTRPYMQVPFQWSCHIEAINGALSHCAYLADGQGDPRRDFAVTLIDAIGKEGAVLVYNAQFERTRLTELADYYADLAPALKAINQRMVNLLPITREHYYHPEMRGKWSIKNVLPTIAPDLAYDDLQVTNGGMAQDAFDEMMRTKTTLKRREQLYEALLLYCERDTLAMVRIAQYFTSAN